MKIAHIVPFFRGDVGNVSLHTLIKALTMAKKVYEEDIILLVASKMLESDVRFLSYVQQDKLPLLYNAADLTIVPSYSEGSPLVIPESLACGTPVVATNVGGNPEYLTLANLNNLLVNIESYDFSRSLALKLIKGLEVDYSVDCKAVPSWTVVAEMYLKALKSIDI